MRVCVLWQLSSKAEPQTDGASLASLLSDFINPAGSEIKSQGEFLLCDAGRGMLACMLLLRGELDYPEFSPWEMQCMNHSQINGKVSKGYWYRQGDVWRKKTTNAEHAVSDLLEAAVPALEREATKTKR